jgi:hemoglobin
MNPRLNFIGLMLCAQLACAQSTPDDSLYQAFGGKAGIERVMADFVPRLRADPQIGSFFKETKMSELQKQLIDQLCVVSGGPCVYEGETMKNSHAEHQIRKADFNAMVELLQLSMDAQGIPFAVQNRMLARLAPMHRDIVNTR